MNRPGGPSRLKLELYADLNSNGQIQGSEKRVVRVERPQAKRKAGG